MFRSWLRSLCLTTCVAAASVPSSAQTREETLDFLFSDQAGGVSNIMDSYPMLLWGEDYQVTVKDCVVTVTGRRGVYQHYSKEQERRKAQAERDKLKDHVNKLVIDFNAIVFDTLEAKSDEFGYVVQVGGRPRAVEFLQHDLDPGTGALRKTHRFHSTLKYRYWVRNDDSRNKAIRMRNALAHFGEKHCRGRAF